MSGRPSERFKKPGTSESVPLKLQIVPLPIQIRPLTGQYRHGRQMEPELKVPGRVAPRAAIKRPEPFFEQYSIVVWLLDRRVAQLKRG